MQITPQTLKDNLFHFEISQTDLANAIGIHKSKISGYVRGSEPIPKHRREQIKAYFEELAKM